MKILLLDNSHLPTIGGKEIVVHHLATQYQKLGHDVLVGGPGGYFQHRRVDLGYPVKRFPKLPLVSAERSWAWRIRSLLRQASFDLVHAHTTHPCAYYAAQTFADGAPQIPMVVTPHGADIHKLPEISFGKRLDPILDEKIRWALTQCARATSISQGISDSLVDAGVAQTDIVDIPNGVDIDRFSTQANLDAREELGLSPDTKLLVTIGNAHPRKGHEVLVDAVTECATKHPNVHLVVIGNRLDKLREKVSAQGQQRYVTIAGGLPFPVPGKSNPPDLLAALLQQSDAYVSASVGEGSEGLSLALLEAMAAGTCIVATAVSGTKDVIKTGENGLLVTPGSVSSMAEAITRVCDSEELARSLSARSKADSAGFSWAAVAQRYVALFEEILAAEAR